MPRPPARRPPPARRACGVCAQPQIVTEALLRNMANTVLANGRADSMKLARLLFVIGHVAVKHLVSVEKRAVAKAKTASAAQDKVDHRSVVAHNRPSAGG